MLHKLSRGRNNKAIYVFAAIIMKRYFVYNRKKVCGGFPGSGLGHGNKVAAILYHRNRLLLYRRALAEVHRLDSVEKLVAEV